MIELKPWLLRYEVMNDLYRRVDQSHCLVQIPVPLEKENTFRYLKAVQTGTSNGKDLLVRAIYLDDSLIGKIELSRYKNRAAELDIVIVKEHTSKGYGKQALQKLEEEVKETDWCTGIYAYVDTANLACGKMLAGCGYSIGRFFNASIMVPQSGSYVFGERRGCEMLKNFEESTQ